MRYREIQPPEGINVTPVHPLKEFTLLLGGAILLVVIAVFILGQFGGRLARLVPPATEVTLVSGYGKPSSEKTPLQDYVQEFGLRLATELEMPDGLPVRIHVVEGEVLNAFATLGGNIIIYTGLLKRIPHENALSFLIAHELAHLKHRDPISVLGQSATVSIGLSLILGSSDLPVLESAGLLTTLKFSRDMERRADETAVAVLERVYGHSNGGADLFRVLLEINEKELRVPAFFSTHPGLEDRIGKLQELEVPGAETTPLRDEFKRWLEDNSDTGPAG